MTVDRGTFSFRENSFPSK